MAAPAQASATTTPQSCKKSVTRNQPPFVAFDHGAPLIGHTAPAGGGPDEKRPQCIGLPRRFVDRAGTVARGDGLTLRFRAEPRGLRGRPAEAPRQATRVAPARAAR